MPNAIRYYDGCAGAPTSSTACAVGRRAGAVLVRRLVQLPAALLSSGRGRRSWSTGCGAARPRLRPMRRLISITVGDRQSSVVRGRLAGRVAVVTRPPPASGSRWPRRWRRRGRDARAVRHRSPGGSHGGGAARCDVRRRRRRRGDRVAAGLRGGRGAPPAGWTCWSTTPAVASRRCSPTPRSRAGPACWTSTCARRCSRPSWRSRRCRRRGGGAIVNVASSAGVGLGPHPMPEYAAAKAGLLRLTGALSPLAGRGSG